MKKVITILLLLVTCNAYSQSPWTQEKNHFYTQASFATIPNYSMLYGDPETTTFSEISDQTFQIYGAYGLTDRTSLIVNIPLKFITINDYSSPFIDCDGECSEDYQKTGLGNIELAIKHNFYNKKWLITGQLSVEANTGTYDSRSGIRTGYDATSITPLIIAGRSFDKTYVQAYTGVIWRSNGYSSNFKIGGEIGHRFMDKLWLIGFIDMVNSFENGDINLPIINQFTGLYVNDQEYGALGLKGIYELNNTAGINLGIAGALLGNNVPQQVSLNLGVFQKF